MHQNNIPSVLFVCMGNICRSPAGEGVFRHLVETRHPDLHLRIDSAGTIGYHEGKPADPRMKRAAAARGYSLDSRSRKVTSGDLSDFDLVIAMDHENLRDLNQMVNAETHSDIRLLGEFLEGDDHPDVPDPYYGCGDGFETVLDMIEQACPVILNFLTQRSQA